MLYPRARTSHAGCLDLDHEDKFYVFGGSGKSTGSENFNDLWVFNMGTKIFREVLCGKGFRPPGMYGHTMSYYSSCLYVIGGTTGFDYFKDVYKFDLVAH